MSAQTFIENLRDKRQHYGRYETVDDAQLTVFYDSYVRFRDAVARVTNKNVEPSRERLGTDIMAETRLLSEKSAAITGIVLDQQQADPGAAKQGGIFKTLVSELFDTASETLAKSRARE